MAARSFILTYHSLDDSGSVISMPPDAFKRQMESLAASGVPVVPLDQVLEQPGSVAISFDDGFRNLAAHAMPILERYRFPATIFVVSQFCGARNDWPSQPAGVVPLLPLLSWEELENVPGCIAIGAHTVTHPDLRHVSADECARELEESQDRIQQRLRKPVRWLAYPYGASSVGIRATASRHFDAAVGTSLRFLPARPDRMDLPRLDAYYLRGGFPAERLPTALGAAYIAFRRILREARQAIGR